MHVYSKRENHVTQKECKLERINKQNLKFRQLKYKSRQLLTWHGLSRALLCFLSNFLTTNTLVPTLRIFMVIVRHYASNAEGLKYLQKAGSFEHFDDYKLVFLQDVKKIPIFFIFTCNDI